MSKLCGIFSYKGANPTRSAPTPPSLHLTASLKGSSTNAISLGVRASPEKRGVHVVVVQSSSHDSLDCSTPGLPVPHHLPKFAQSMSTALVTASRHLLLWCPLLLPSIFPSIRDFSNESALWIRWPKYWSHLMRTADSLDWVNQPPKNS